MKPYYKVKIKANLEVELQQLMPLVLAVFEVQLEAPHQQLKKSTSNFQKEQQWVQQGHMEGECIPPGVPNDCAFFSVQICFHFALETMNSVTQKKKLINLIEKSYLQKRIKKTVAIKMTDGLCDQRHKQFQKGSCRYMMRNQRLFWRLFLIHAN